MSKSSKGHADDDYEDDYYEDDFEDDFEDDGGGSLHKQEGKQAERRTPGPGPAGAVGRISILAT